MRKAILDTNIISYFLRGNAAVVNKLSQYSQFYTALTFSLLTYYEIKSGLLYKNASNLLTRFEELASESEILPLSLTTMNIASDIYADLRQQGLLVPPIDILIAASTIEFNALLVTANLRHFTIIQNLDCENWAE
ncbi:MAG: type II toxin-antitoxin system VapC family toxin [Cyanobacteria bacterium CRU_2_1]|nr:type II toxin-antitoxin system VapC family toxin [Cyanobacteria bacterium RU_5_0]NJR57893.1 type II toxin-antitoxin system VapC family toxin [Cyanobacteria bacterium CRU_2_1]